MLIKGRFFELIDKIYKVTI